jgi:transglutaminase superfamily protein
LRRLAELARLPVAERRLLVQAALLLATVRVALVLLRWPVVRRLAARAARPVAGGAPVAAAALQRAVERAGRHVPGATCLSQAIALQILLGRRGRTADLRLGVAPGEGRRLEAHAWLEAEGHVLIGAAGRERYTPLPPLPAAK